MPRLGIQQVLSVAFLSPLMRLKLRNRHHRWPPNRSRPHRIGSGSGAATALTLTIRKMAEEEWQIVRRVPNKGQDGMVNEMVLPRAGTIASWIRNTMTETNKAYGLAIAAFIEAGGTVPAQRTWLWRRHYGRGRGAPTRENRVS
jgi:hypothetical protein